MYPLAMLDTMIAARNEHVHGVDRGAQVTGVVVASLCLSWIAVTLRFFVRVNLQKMFGAEDWLTIASMIIFTVLCAFTLYALKFGLGVHIINIDDYYFEILSKFTFISELLYVVTMAIIKVSIGFYFLRLAAKPYQISVIYLIMLICIVYSTAYFFFLTFQCRPVSYFWTRALDAHEHCFNKDVLAWGTYVHAAFCAATDWTFGLLPITFVWKMKMNLWTKLSVILVLSLGFFASTATFVRVNYIHRLKHTIDYTWEGINLVKWSIVEPAIGITAASIATLRPLFRKYLSLGRIFSFYSTRSAAASRSSFNYFSDNGEDYTQEFTELLGLRQIGIRTLIYSPNRPDWVYIARPGEYGRLSDKEERARRAAELADLAARRAASEVEAEAEAEEGKAGEVSTSVDEITPLEPIKEDCTDLDRSIMATTTITTIIEED